MKAVKILAKNRTKHFPAVALALLLAVYIAAIGLWSYKGSHEKLAPKASHGVIDLAEWDLKQDGVVELDGEWEFYWQRLLTPNSVNGHSGERGFVLVPNQWNKYTINDEKLTEEGYATYRLTLKLPQPHMRLGLKLPDIATSYNIWVDGKYLGAAGIVGSKADLFQPDYQPQAVYFENDDDTVEVIIQVANFAHHKGGLKSSLQFGTDQDIRQLREKRMALDVFLFGVFLIMACYHFGLYGLRHKEKSPLYFGLFCLLVAARIMVTGEILAAEFLPNLDWQLIIKVEYLTYYLGLPVFLGFIYFLFPQETSQWLFKIVNLVGIAFSAIVLLSPVKVFSNTLMCYNLVTLAVSVHMLIAIYKAAAADKEGALLFGLGAGVIILSAINDILFNNNLVNTGNLMPLGLFVFIFIQSFVLSSRFSGALSAVERMSEKLRKSRDEIAAWNKKLEKTVDKRTAAVRNLLNNAGQGFLTIGYDLLIRREYSSECIKIFQQDIKFKNLAHLVYPENEQEQSFMQEALQQVLCEKDAAMQQVYLSLLPEEVIINKKNIKLEYKLLGSDKHVDQGLMVILTDMTEKRLIERQMERERLVLKMVVRVIQSKRDFLNSIEEYRNFCNAGISAIIGSNLNVDEIIFEIFRKTHTFKGNFAQLGMVNLTESLSAMEEELSALGRNSKSLMTVKELTEFLERFDMQSWLEKDIEILREIIGEEILLAESGIVISHSQLAQFEMLISGLSQQSERERLMTEIYKLKSVYFRDLVSKYPDLTQLLAEREGKRVKPFSIDGGDFPVDPNQYNALTNSFIHLFVNSVHHGIEPMEERVASGKGEVGVIFFRIGLSDGAIKVTITDDGSGINFDKVREKAVGKGLYTKEEASALSEDQLINLIFESQFSTTDGVTLLSGCGVGMAVVKREVETLGGTISVHTKAGQGTSYIITVPYYGG